MKSIRMLLVGLLFPAWVYGAVRTEQMEYTDGETRMVGYVAWDDAVEGPRPGVLVVHEWWGHNAYARMRAEMLAELGYTALAIDMYGEGRTASHPSDAGAFATEVRSNSEMARGRFKAAWEALAAHPMADGKRIAAIGYCFGGAVVLDAARAGFDLTAVVSFHGSLGTDTPAEKGVIKASVLVCNGADDPFVTAEQIGAFCAEMAATQVDFAFLNLPGAVHSFTSKEADANGEKFNLPLAYNADADARSWAAMKEFLARSFAR